LPINSLGSDAALIAVSMQGSKHLKLVFLYSISTPPRQASIHAMNALGAGILLGSDWKGQWRCHSQSG
ncbi:MAG TPA: hypothetical protein VN857_15995, partial [Chthoniobacterales bacterium]|nr:hypothetical protein [Chthoniobacterales bacterium]